MEANALICYGSGRSVECERAILLAGGRYRKMASNALLAKVAALAGDPGRASMLNALMDGRALTATELTEVVGITPQTASRHLSRTIGVGLLNVEKQGRHRYYRLATPSVAQMLESIMQVASELATSSKKLAVGPKEAAHRMTGADSKSCGKLLYAALIHRALMDQPHCPVDCRS